MRITKAIIDELGALEDKARGLQQRIAEIRDALKVAPASLFKGNTYQVEKAVVETSRLSAPKVKALLSPAQIAQCTQKGSRVELRVKTIVKLEV